MAAGKLSSLDSTNTDRQPQRASLLAGRSAAKVLAAAIVWGIASWFIARASFVLRADDLIRYEAQLGEVKAQRLADSLQQNIDFLSGIPDLLSINPSIRRVVSRFAVLQGLPRNAMKHRLASDAELSGLDRYLQAVQANLKLDVVYVVNGRGDCIAASNWNSPDSLIGARVGGDEGFRMNRGGQRGMQYAVGADAQITGLYFSTPITVNGRFMGAVVARADSRKLSSLIEQFDAYVADRNGVIILANDKDMVMQAMPDALVRKMPVDERKAIYRRSDFAPLSNESWGEAKYPMLMRVQDETVPHLIASAAMPVYGFEVHIQNELAQFMTLQDDRGTLFWVFAAGGWGAILLTASLLAYLRNMGRAKNEMEHLANHDMLTQLPNSRYFERLLKSEVARARSLVATLALMRMHLDGFKEVNDTWGHHVGDAVFVEVSRRIRACVGEGGIVARVGGNEFTVILPEVRDHSHIEAVAGGLVETLAKPFKLGQEFALISTNIGIAVFPEDATEPGQLEIQADQAMNAAKRAGHNHYNFFVPALENAAQTRRMLIKELGNTLAQHQLQVYYQPIVELKTGRIHKAEALLRWQHPVHGMISPADFIPLAESSGMIFEIGDWVFMQAAQQAKSWRQKFDPAFQISVNKSPVQLRESAARQREGWVDYLTRHGLAGDSICVEITEGVLLDTEQGVAERLQEFGHAGIQVSIDDFGTGYSSLAYLKKFEIDYLKIDKAFVRDLATDRTDLAMCEAIITMAHKLGLKVIAEGVETEQQRDILAACNCDYAQGYLYSRPVAPQELERLLATGAGQRAMIG